MRDVSIRQMLSHTSTPPISCSASPTRIITESAIVPNRAAGHVNDGLTVITLMNLGDADPGAFAHGIAGVVEPALKPAAAKP